ncbi:SDR family oxidoreductase [Egibacter rhizosphaerae]|uniref:SDR family oxidoreductase n=1 Tax=Egibacter rhizosphaerae TaxID=1670831 RepID=A0A411YII2_9ACTN|nr:SDR family oxidoreductase [Egibacter rhizosphaerae]QBI20896.1 SDR family oxidoreductase [Egibacter rhizosphaerae]
MATDGCIVVVGGTAGLGRELAQHYADAGHEVVLTGRDAERAAQVAKEVGGRTSGLGFDLAEPEGIADATAGIGPVSRLALVGIERDNNTVREFNIAAARHLAALKLVGYTEVVHALADRLSTESSIVLFGGLAKDRPYPGSITVSTVNGGVTGMVTAMATELAPIRVNALHPGIVADSPFWADKPESVLEGFRSRTPTGQLATMADVVYAAEFLLENPSMNAANLHVEGGALIM